VIGPQSQLFIERAEVSDFDRMSEPERRAAIKQRLEKLGRSDKPKDGALN
jgi:hypothetical protein